MSKKVLSLAARYGRKTDIVEIWQDILDERYSIPAYDNPPYPIITGQDQIQVMTWGLIPFWIKPRGTGSDAVREAREKAARCSRSTINARAETIFDLPSYRGVIMRRRCLIPSTGYFEFHYEPGQKYAIPYYLYLPSQEVFSMAGIYDEWTDPQSGERLRTFSQITTTANPLARAIHNGGKNPFRMPVILHPGEEELWLDPGLDKEGVKSLMRPYPDALMEAYPVSREFRLTDPRDPSVILPAS